MIKYNLLIIEDNVPYRSALVEIVSHLADIRIVGAFSSYEDAKPLLKKQPIDIVLLDIELPGINGVEAVGKIKTTHPKAMILMVTVFEDSEKVFNALCNGATGYITKNASGSQIIAAIEDMIAGGSPMSAQIARMVVSSFQKTTSSVLSERETDVLTLMAQGNSYSKIASKLFISGNTVKFHIKNIYDKLHVNSKEDAISEAKKKRIL
ncbi:MAG: response regulator transcription factor [Lewinellaceae bacterium]|nr:response regulator transcription factor [Lewinellaceae bacterium]